MSFPRLQAILDVDAASAAGWAPGDLVMAFLDGGARFIQLRAKHLASGLFLELCDHAMSSATSYGALLIVNDRADLARMAGASGVHLGQDDLAPAAARVMLGPHAIVGFSTHTLDQIEAAVHEPVSYVAVGPVFGTRTKDTGYDAVGLERVTAAARAAGDIPVVAIGGITLETAPAVLEAGASTVAVIGDLLATGDPARRVADYRRILEDPRSQIPDPKSQ